MRGHGRSCKPNSLDGHSSELYAADFKAVCDAFGLVKPVYCGWSLAAANITDIVANLKPWPIAGAIALGGSPGINGDIVPVIGTPLLLKTLPRFNDNTNVSEAIAARIEFVDACFDEPDKVSHALKCRYLGETLLQTPDVSACVSMRPQDPEQLFEAGRNGLPLLVLFGKNDLLVNGEAVVNIVKPHFKNLQTVFIRGGHSLFDDNEDGMAEEVTKFVLSVQVGHPQILKSKASSSPFVIMSVKEQDLLGIAMYHFDPGPRGVFVVPVVRNPTISGAL
ncbi:hypothetical protein HGRIS_011572 [Hohenbuehelia grisea]|uniref:AB hydrolase-1 domain-containing protein n=1 Tax=Hohenbuehelia grisea TaxID=104357 RepID=A0ABR3JVQ1_9AGAR